MIDIEKEMELPEKSGSEKESSKVSEQKKEETLTEKESSQAADQESVTKKDENSEIKTDSSTQESEESLTGKPSTPPPDESIQPVAPGESNTPVLEKKLDNDDLIEKVEEKEAILPDEPAEEVVAEQTIPDDENSEIKTDSSTQESEESLTGKPSTPPPDDSIQPVAPEESNTPVLEKEPEKIDLIEKVEEKEAILPDEPAEEVISEQTIPDDENSEIKTDSSTQESEESLVGKSSTPPPPDDSIQPVAPEESNTPVLEKEPEKVDLIEKIEEKEAILPDEPAEEVISDQPSSEPENLTTDKEIKERTPEEDNTQIDTEVPEKEINQQDDLSEEEIVDQDKPEIEKLQTENETEAVVSEEKNTQQNIEEPTKEIAEPDDPSKQIKSEVQEEETSKSETTNTKSDVEGLEISLEENAVSKDSMTDDSVEPKKEEAIDTEKEQVEASKEKAEDKAKVEEEEEKDFSTMAKDELVNEFEALLQETNLKFIERKYRELKPFYDRYVTGEKKIALDKFTKEGGAEIDFRFVGDALNSRFSSIYEKYKARRNEYYVDLEKQKGGNLERKQEVLEKLRSIVDGEETNTSIGALKHIQQEWRSIGPVPGQNTKSLWATFNILIDRFYDNRSIYFELKELDRKKNLELKLEICEKAELLIDREVIRDAVKELNEFHEEFKHIGPVPKEMQEAVWQRFKSASDAVYSRRKDYVNDLKKELHENLGEKEKLVEVVSQYGTYTSDKISEWNEKTKEVIDLQKKWELIGGLPREHAKDVNKHFWSSFKSFFNNKNKFFKKLESQRDDNLKLKEELVARADALKNNNDWEKTADALKELQQEWKNIGPVPEKVRNEIYKKFKQACDTFFNRRREHSKDIEGEYRKNLIEKEGICAEIEKMVTDKAMELGLFKKLQAKYQSIGFVPRNAIKKIQKKYNYVNDLFLNGFDLSDQEKSEIRFAAEINKLKSSPNADRRIYRKESELRRMISKIENDIKATDQLKELKDELSMLNKI